MSTEEHKRHAPESINAAIITISNSRILENDQSGSSIKNVLEKNNHKVVEYSIIPDDIKAIKPLFEKELISFNALFTKLSYGTVGSAAILSRATAGVVCKKVIFCLPGSLKACQLAMQKLILPEVGHIMKHLND